ncbi:HMGL-like domain protein [Leptospira borgpetersenii serovar Pomona str. 200901868]|uniref:HMGL-like domain protein n=1 Tax=Leptospira borgpetersenii serovar Pomona str. 200901868 TaxID=1192866 RepID=M6W033_LEPBO|nr:HMGL-like domain protein [Leptospira borgpetersenii serovar Hardjo]EMO62440.1 HMGL-like domain protein [Leptospira borgpetersenii serovar Pomona str. 200901868]
MEIKITEVGPRDGLQNEKRAVSTEIKAEYIRRLVQAGLKNIEATSFVKKESIPQLADASELSALLDLNGHIHYSALTPNIRGYEAAKNAGYKEVAVFTAASESFTKKISIEQSRNPSTDLKKFSNLRKTTVSEFAVMFPP